MLTVEDIQTILDNDLPCDIECPHCELTIEEVIPQKDIQDLAHKLFEMIQEIGLD